MTTPQISRDFYSKNGEHFDAVSQVFKDSLEWGIFSEEIKQKIQSFLHWKENQNQEGFEVECSDIDAILPVITDIKIKNIIKGLRERCSLKFTLEKGREDKHGANLLSSRDLGINLSNLLKSEASLFSSIIFYLEKAKIIDANHLGMALRIAKRDQTCTFGDIRFALEKAKIIDANHLGMSLQIAKRNQTCTFGDIRFALEKAEIIEVNHLGMSLEIAKRNQTCTFGDIRFALKKAKIIDATHLGIALEIANRDLKCNGDSAYWLLELAEKHELTPDDGHMRIVEELKARST